MYNKVSIVIPVYNEQNIIFESITKLIHWRNKNNLGFEIIIIDDGSSDNTYKILLSFNKKIKLIKQKHSGQFTAIIKGIKRSKKDLVIVMESDLSINYNIIKTLMITKKKTGADIVTVSINHKKSINYNKPFYRKILSFFNIIIFNFFFKTKLTDPQVSVKIYDRETFINLSKKLISPNDGMKSTEILLYYLINNMKIVEIPAIYHNRNTSQNVSLSNIVKVSISCLVSLFLIWKEIKNKDRIGLLKTNLI